MNKVAKNKLHLHLTLKGSSSTLRLLFFFFLFLMGLAAPLASRGQDAPSISREDLSSGKAEAIEESRFLILKEGLDRLSKQLTKHKRPSSPGIPGHIEKKDLDLPAFPEMTEEDGIEDSILILKKRLENLHHVLHQES